jgi:hypothetical protein
MMQSNTDFLTPTLLRRSIQSVRKTMKNVHGDFGGNIGDLPQRCVKL